MAPDTEALEYETLEGYSEVYMTRLGPAIKTEGVKPGVPSYVFITAVVSKLEEEYDSKKELADDQGYSIEQIEQALEFDENEDVTDLRNELDKTSFTDFDH